MSSPTPEPTAGGSPQEQELQAYETAMTDAISRIEDTKVAKATFNIFMKEIKPRIRECVDRRGQETEALWRGKMQGANSIAS